MPLLGAAAMSTFVKLSVLFAMGRDEYSYCGDGPFLCFDICGLAVSESERELLWGRGVENVVLVVRRVEELNAF